MTNSRKAFLRGAAHALPFFVVIIPFAMLFGVLSAEAGLGPWETQIFSVAVFAGAANLATSLLGTFVCAFISLPLTAKIYTWMEPKVFGKNSAVLAEKENAK